MSTRELLVSFYGDDFTGSTDAMEALAVAGVRTVLFSHVPSRQELSYYPGLRAFGVAGTTRAMPPLEMEQTLRAAFTALKACGAPIVHYKVCSTFDSSPAVGSIGRAIDVGADVFDAARVPVVVGAPSLGRYCVFGNLFARCGAEGPPVRLDRHPSMSRHPVTPMDEADLRVHLAKQTSKSIGLIDVLDVERGRIDLARSDAQVVLIDLLTDRQLGAVGRAIQQYADAQGTAFVVGSSGVESALAVHWNVPPANFEPVAPVDAVLVVCGSCSPVSARQVQWAERRGFAALSFTARDARDAAVAALRGGRSAIIHTSDLSEARSRPGERLGRLVRDVIEAARVRRLLVAGGDTAGEVARALAVRSMEMVGELTRGAPLCRVSASGSPADGIEACFKGGQIGGEDFFGLVQSGAAHG